jgi:signal transduction histidine kinase
MSETVKRKHMLRASMLIILFGCQLLVNAQKQGQMLVDSLLNEIPNIKADTSVIKLYNRISDLYIDIDQEKAMHYADSALTKSKNINWKRGIASSMLAIGNVYNFNGNPDKAIKYLEEATVIFKEIGYKFGEAASFAALGKSYEALSNYPAAVTNFTQALKIHESIPNNDLRIATSLSGIANIYYFQRDYKKSLEYSFKALAKKELLKNKISIANENLAIGDTYSEMGDSANAEKFSLKALELFKELGNKMGMANVYSNLGKLYRKNYSKSLEYFYQAKKMFTELNDDSPSLFLMQGQVGQVFLDMAKYGDTLSSALKKKYDIPETKTDLLDAAETNLKKAIIASRENEDKENEYIFSGAIAEVQALKNDYKNAYSNLYVYHYLQDSLYSQENKNKIAAVEGEREVAIRDKKIELANLSIATQKKQRIALIGGLCLLAIIGGLLFWQSRTRKKTNTTLMVLNNQLDDANKVKAKFFAILSHDLRSPIANLVNFLHLQKNEPGMFNAEQAAAHQKKISSSAENLLETMEAMLLWSKGQMENFKPEIKQVAVNDLFLYLQKFFASTENVKFSFANATNAMVTTDENYLQTIMHNLTANAVKALKNTPAAAIEWVSKQEGDKTILTITDNGPGLQDEQLKALYDDAVVANTKTGLGLHLIRDLAKAIQCKISVQSKPGIGTTFTLLA